MFFSLSQALKQFVFVSNRRRLVLLSYVFGCWFSAFISLVYYYRSVLQGWQKCKCHDLNEMYRHTLSPEERARIETLDPFDEYEEFNLKCAHYFVLVASTSSSISDFLFKSARDAGIVVRNKVMLQCCSHALPHTHIHTLLFYLLAFIFVLGTQVNIENGC